MALPKIIQKFNTHVATNGSADSFGHLKLSDAVNSTSSTSGGFAATPAAVKAAYDLATTAKNTADEAKSLGTVAYTYKGSVSTVADLDNVSNPKNGYVYNVTASGANYAYVEAVGTEGQSGYVAAHWDNLGAVIQVDTALDDESVNPVENRVITNALSTLANSTHVHEQLKIKNSSGTYTNSTYDGGTAVTIDKVYEAASADSATTASSADEATKLSTARTLTVDLSGSQTHNNFDGTANVYLATTGVLPVSAGGTGSTSSADALTNLGLTATASELNTLDGITASTTELNYVDGVTSAIQDQIDGKADSSHTHGNISNDGKLTTKGVVVVTDATDGSIKGSTTITVTELEYLDGVTSSIQDQLDAKLDEAEVPSPSNSSPAALGATASAGTGTDYSRANHVHPGPTIQLTGDATTSATQLTGTSTISISTTLATVNTDTTATGNASATTLTNGGSFNVPHITANGKGLVTNNDNIAITLPQLVGQNGTSVTAGTGTDAGKLFIENSGARSVATGTSGGTISVNTNGTSADVVVKGLRGSISTPITAGVAVTTPSYIVGSNRLIVMIDGVVCQPTVTYTEQGTAGNTSTTIKFVDDIDNTYVVDVLVI